MGVIFDLDLTLVNSQIAEAYRTSRNWKQVYSLIPKFTLYDGIAELIAELQKQNIPICIVTSSPESYCKKVLAHFGLNVPTMVCYHHTQLRKPHPAPLQLALKKMGVSADKVVNVGDDPKDIQAGRAAGIKTNLGVSYGVKNVKELKSTKPDMVCESVTSLRKAIIRELGLKLNP